MYSFRAESANEVWLQAVQGIYQTHITKPSRVFDKDDLGETMEFPEPVALIVDNPQDRLVTARAVNPAFAIAEVIWILSGSNKLDFIKFWNPLMAKFSDDGEMLYGAYGHRLGSPVKTHMMHPNQIERAYLTLEKSPHSRQVILQIWNHHYDLPVEDSPGKTRASDIPCNIVADLKVRDGKLYWTQFMRSNDLIWGTPYNFMQWMTLQEIMAGWLDLELGTYTHVATSLHVYERHYDELASVVTNNKTDSLPKHWTPIDHIHGIKNYDDWKRVFNIVLGAATALIHAVDSDHTTQIFQQAGWHLDALEEVSDEARAAYFHWIALLAAETLRRRKFTTLEEIMDNRSWVSSIDNYYWYPWLRWANSLGK